MNRPIWQADTQRHGGSKALWFMELSVRVTVRDELNLSAQTMAPASEPKL